LHNYKFVITTGGTITATLGTLPGDYDLKLLNSAGTQVGISQNGGTTSESISYTPAAGTYYAQVYGYNGANSATTCYTLKVQLGTATKPVTELVTDAVKIYPNPVIDVLNISIPGKVNNGTIKVVDARGVVITDQKVTNNLQHINVSKLAKGVYLLKVNNNGTDSILKFVKQ